MTNAFGIVLDNASVRWAAAEGVPETVIAAVLLLDERSVDEIVAKLRPGELDQVIKLVSRSPRCYPPGALDALKGRRPAPSPKHVASSSTNAASSQPAARIKPSAEQMRRAQEHRLARLRVHVAESAAETERGFTHIHRRHAGPVDHLHGGGTARNRGNRRRGQDVSIGYLSHTEAIVRLYLQETFTFLLLTTEAAVALVAPGNAQ
jgi:hypothetical protein